MKTIKYLLAAFLVCITIISSSWKNQENNKTITLQAVESTVTSDLLKQSSDIISERLTSYGLDSFCIAINDEKRQIVVTVNDKADFTDIEILLTAKGSLAFYETYSIDEFSGIVKDDRLLKMLAKSYSGLGSADEGQIKAVNDCINSYGNIEGCRLLWKPKTDDKPACLYALKVDIHGKPLLERSDFDSITFSRQSRIEVSFKPEAARIFAVATENNIGREIAITIDDRVSSSPRIMAAIKGGKCEVSGDFTDKGSCLSLALVTNVPLPVSLYVLK